MGQPNDLRHPVPGNAIRNEMPGLADTPALLNPLEAGAQMVGADPGHPWDGT